MSHKSAMTTAGPITDGRRYISKFDKESVAVYVFLQSLEYYVIFYYLFLHLTSDAINNTSYSHRRQY
jgi:hypothetical protein